MWSQIILCLFVGLSYSSAIPGFKDNTEYVYLVNGRTLSSLHDVADQYSGIFLKCKLHICSRPDGKVQGKIVDPQYAQLQSQLPNGWDTKVPESQISYKQLPLIEKPFQIVVEKGLIKTLIVEKELPNWQANIIKSIVSQFQLDLQGQNYVENPINSFPTNDRLEGVFNTMEETVTGKTETFYNIHRLPEYLLQTEPWLAPQQNLKGDGDVIEVIKSKNYTHAEDRPSYHYGFGMAEESEPVSNQLGQFFIRESYSRVILTGKLSRYAIQSSYTVNKILINPTFKNKEMGSVVSMVNVTLSEIRNQQQLEDLSNPTEIGNLVYTYESPFSKNNQVHTKLQSASNDDTHSDESSEDAWKRYGRSARQMIYKQNEKRSSEQYVQYQPRPQMSLAPESPLLPYMMGYHGKSVKENSDFDVKKNVETLVQEISEDIQDPERILKESSLNKFTILNTLVRLMNEEEIKSVAEQLYTQSQQGQQRLSWAVYRDSVAEAGTGPAFSNIKQWIESKKIQNYEAAEVIETMTYAVRVPTEEYMRNFFELVKDPQVKEQEYLNQSTVLCFSDLVFRVYMSRHIAHNHYPVHSFGSFYTKEGREFVRSTVIPYFSQQLDDVISKGDTEKIHVYIRALRNIGHEKILDAFEPYLEGRKQASQFQRMLMVSAMNRLACINPAVGRSVLYKIYQNTGELPEVRVVAVYELILTSPPVEMLQRMAQNTNTDPQEPVNAAIKSVIEALCQLKSPKVYHLRKAAESAQPLLTRKEYGQDSSLLQFHEYLVDQMGLDLRHIYLQAGSEDANWPKILDLYVGGEMHGMIYQYFAVEGMVSSISELTNVLYRQTDQYQQAKSERSQQQSTDKKWSSANIAQQMNYQRREREQLEGFIFTEIGYMQKLWSFDNQTVEQLPEVYRQQEEILKNGRQFSYTKLKQMREMALSFPTEMGFPFLYTYDVPLLIKFEGKIKAVATPQVCKDNKWYWPDLISTEINSYITVSTKTQSQLSFITPFDHQVYMAGYDRNGQIHVPVNAKVEADIKGKLIRTDFEIEETHKDARLLHFWAYPYTSRSDVMTIRPVALRPNTYVIKTHQHEHRYFDVAFGKKQTGLTFRAWGHHPGQTTDLSELARIFNAKGVITMWDQLWDKYGLQYSEVSLAFVPSQSTVRKLTLRYKYDQRYKKQPETQKDEDFWSLSQLASKLETDDSMQRQQEIIKYVGSGINSAYLYSSDFTLESDGEKKYKHVFGFVYGKSNADPKSRTLIYYKNKHENKQFAFEVKGEIPNINGLDLTYSLETEPSAKYDVRIQYAQSNDKATQISGKFDLKRSEARKAYLIYQDPMYQVCKTQMQQRNFQLPACQNMTIKANFLDYIKYQFKYENLNKQFAENIEGVFKGLRVYYYPMTEVTDVQSQGNNVVNGYIRFHPEHFRQLNVTVRANDEETTIYNLSIYNEALKNVLVPHPVFHLPSRYYGYVKGWQNYRPTCVIDQNVAQTFNNRTYPLSLDKQYTVVMQYIPHDARLRGDDQLTVEKQLKEQLENYVVLARQVSSEEKELIITFNHRYSRGKTVQIDMKPKQGQPSGSNPVAAVFVDGQQLQFNDKEIADLYDSFVQVYALPNGEVKLEIQDAFYLIFDGKRIKLTSTGSKLRDSITGLCGHFSYDEYEDFTVPAGCVVRDPQKFVKYYQVENSQQHGQRLSDQECVEKVLPLYADVISDLDNNRRNENSWSQGSQGPNGVKLRHRYIEENGEICFTIYPIPTCSQSAQNAVTKNIPVHCVQSTKAAYHLKSQIDKGGNPDFSHKPETKKVRMEVPLQCN